MEMTFEIKRAFIRFGNLMDFLGTKANARAKAVYLHVLPTVEDAKLCIDYLQDLTTGREFLKEWSISFLLDSMTWDDYLTNTAAGKEFYNSCPKECQEARKAIKLLEESGSILEEFEDMTKEAVTANSRAAVPVLPAELATEAAAVYWNRAKAAGWVNEDYSFNGTKYQMAFFAEIMAEKLGYKGGKWKPFIKLWGVKHIAQTRHESIDRFGYVDREKELEKLFE